jgi:hypothetical protein
MLETADVMIMPSVACPAGLVLRGFVTALGIPGNSGMGEIVPCTALSNPYRSQLDVPKGSERSLGLLSVIVKKSIQSLPKIVLVGDPDRHAVVAVKRLLHSLWGGASIRRGLPRRPAVNFQITAFGLFLLVPYLSSHLAGYRQPHHETRSCLHVLFCP